MKQTQENNIQFLFGNSDGLMDQNYWICQDIINQERNIKAKVKDESNKGKKAICQITRGSKLTDDQKKMIQKTLAQKFITIGYGYNTNMKAVKKRHKIVIDATYYNNTMSSIVRKAFRQLEQFLKYDCKQQSIVQKNNQQANLLRSPMLQCVKWMKQEELNTFYKFIYRVYQFKKVYISEDQASRLYGQILQSADNGHQISFIILQRTKKRMDEKYFQGLTFSYAPSATVAKHISSSSPLKKRNKRIQQQQ